MNRILVCNELENVDYLAYLQRSATFFFFKLLTSEVLLYLRFENIDCLHVRTLALYPSKLISLSVLLSAWSQTKGLYTSS